MLMECSERFGCTKVIKDPILAFKELEIHEAEDDIAAKQSKCLFEGALRRAGLAKGSPCRPCPGPVSSLAFPRTHTLLYHRRVWRQLKSGPP